MITSAPGSAEKVRRGDAESLLGFGPIGALSDSFPGAGLPGPRLRIRIMRLPSRWNDGKNFPAFDARQHTGDRRRWSVGGLSVCDEPEVRHRWRRRSRATPAGSGG